MCARVLCRIPLTGLFLVAWSLAPALGQQPSSDDKPAATPSLSPPRRGPRPGDIQKVFVLKHARPEGMEGALSVFPADIQSGWVSHRATLAVSAAPAVMAAIDETIKRLDVPPPPTKAVDVNGYILECTAKDGESGSVPDELQDVVAQLRRAFKYTGCALAQTLFVRGSDGSTFRSASGGHTIAAMLEVDASQGAPVVRFKRFSFQTTGRDRGFSGDVEVRDGQRVVLGKLGAESGKEQLLVLSAKVVD